MTDYCSDGSFNDSNKELCRNSIDQYISSVNTSYTEYDTAFTLYKNYPTTPNEETANNKLADLTTKLETLENKIINLKQNYDIDLTKDIVTKYQAIVDKRQVLDRKLYDLYTNEYNSSYSVKPLVDSTVFIGVIGTVLASTMLYYIIVKI
jgi:hypothetical protein